MILIERGDVNGLRELLAGPYPRVRNAPRPDPQRVIPLIRAGLQDEAEEELLLMPTRPKREWAALYLAQGRLAEAIAGFKESNDPTLTPRGLPQRLEGFLGLSQAWEESGDLQLAIDALATRFSRRSEAAVELGSGRSLGRIWIEGRSNLARLYRKDGRARDAHVIEAEIRSLLAVADSGHPRLLALSGGR